MKKLFLSIVCAFSMAGCDTFDASKVKPWIEPAVLILVIDSPKNAAKAVKFADRIDALVDLSVKELTLADFVKVTQDLDVDAKWAIVTNSVYGIYKDKLNGNLENRVEAVKAVKEFTKKVRDTAILFVIPSK